jgi:hypothetical protein
MDWPAAGSATLPRRPKKARDYTTKAFFSFFFTGLFFRTT